MNVKLKIEEDAELRNYIKDLIKGQVVSILREEIKNLSAEVVNKYAKLNLQEIIQYLIRQNENWKTLTKVDNIREMVYKATYEIVTKHFNEMEKRNE